MSRIRIDHVKGRVQLEREIARRVVDAGRAHGNGRTLHAREHLTRCSSCCRHRPEPIANRVEEATAVHRLPHGLAGALYGQASAWTSSRGHSPDTPPATVVRGEVDPSPVA